MPFDLQKPRFVRLKKLCKMIGFLRHCKYTLTRDLKLQFYKYFIKPVIEYGLLEYGSTSESQLRPILILQEKILWIIYNFRSHASCTHLFIESGIQTVYAMYVGALLKYLLFRFRNTVENACPCHITWKQEGNKRFCFTMLKPVSLQKTQSITKQSNCRIWLKKLVYGPLA